MGVAEIFLERETSNDESAIVVKIYVASGEIVREGQAVFDVENSKATQEVVAPADGVLTHSLIVGETIEFGVAVAKVVDRADGADDVGPPAIEAGDSALAPNAASSLAPHVTAVRAPKFSKAAAELMARNSTIDPTSFAIDFVTERDVRERLGLVVHRQTQVDQTQVDQAQVEEARHVQRTADQRELAAQPVLGRKRVEVSSLSRGAGGSGVLSVLGARLGRISLQRELNDLFAGRITDIVIYEASRLLLKFEKLNAFYDNGTVYRHPSVVAGLAMDDGGRLVVYGIENASCLDLRSLRSVIGDAVTRYVENSLSAAEMARATFTVTDLSSSPLDFVYPLLPFGQSCIIGVTRNRNEEFSLHVGFDHRVTEGREVALFVEELGSRLQSYVRLGPAAEPRCYYCDRAVSEYVRQFKGKGFMKLIDAKGVEVFCCPMCWDGW